MNESTDILVPRENVNDESATLLAWLRDDGAFVERGELVAQIETSKAVMDLAASNSGIVRHGARVGQEIPIGAAIGRVVSRAAAELDSANSSSSREIAAVREEVVLRDISNLAPSVRRIVTEHGVDPAQLDASGRGGRITKEDVLSYLSRRAATAPHAGGPTRFSAKARRLVNELGLDPAAFEGRGLVRSRDLLPEVNHAPSIERAILETESPKAPARPVAGVSVRCEPLARAKRTEGNYLRSAFETTLASVVTVSCPTRGFRELAAGRTTPIMIFEVARLLKKYPVFNAFHSDGKIHYYEEINVGFAIDAGKGLKVPVIRAADRKGVAAIELEMREFIVAYLEGSLSAEALAGGTFTLTDLSGEGVVAFHPLINRGQSAILGICSEVLHPDNRQGAFNIILAFDHQISEGRTAARFLGELRERIGFYESSLSRNGELASPSEEPKCSKCMRTFSELASTRHSLVQAVSREGSTRLLCTICLEGWS